MGIIVITIGILGAFILDNWNEERKSDKIEREVLSRLMNDIESDFRMLRNIDSAYQLSIVQLVRSHELILKENHSQEESEELSQYDGVQFLDINPRRTSYDEMINSGKIYDLSNKLLVENISNCYEQIESLIYKTRQTRIEFRAIFYGKDLSDFWLTLHRKDPNHKKLVHDFFNKPTSRAYKLLKQCAGWSVFIASDFQLQASQLSQLNRTLFDKINAEVNSD